MKKAKIDLKPRTRAEAINLAEQNFKLDIQYAMLDEMTRKCVDRTMLILMFFITSHRLNEIFSGNFSLSDPDIIKIISKLGLKRNN